MIGIPAFCERESLPHTLAALAAQEDRDFEVRVLVNQPRSYFADPSRLAVTEENLASLEWLGQEKAHLPFRLRVLDAVQPQLAAEDRLAGVGWARKRLFDEACATGDPLCISLDADTLMPRNYTRVIREDFGRYPNGVGIVIPYYHPLPRDPSVALLLLRYEIYMRYYQLSLWRIGSPYAFLALGSAFAFRAGAYRRAGGIPPRSAGEDFYFLQQLRKTGPLIRAVETCVYPAARASTRVPFGTGPLLAEADLALQESRFPFYSQAAFDLLEKSFELFPQLYQKALKLPIEDYLGAAFQGDGAYAKLRRVLPSQAHFVKACHERIDGLRCLQALRSYASTHPGGAEPVAVQELLARWGQTTPAFRFATEELPLLANLRHQLFQLENQNQRTFMDQWDPKARW